MNELLRVNYDSDRITLSARELHEFLGIRTQYSKWFERMSGYGFDENVDYRAISQKRLTAQGNETTYNDHEITLDMAKEIAMIQRSKKGKQVRQYFLELERKWNSPEAVMNRALEYSRKQVQALLQTNEKLELENKIQSQQIAELKPKASYYDVVLNCKDLLSISVIAKDYGWSAIRLNEYLHKKGVQFKQGKTWLLYQKYAVKGYTSTKTHEYLGNDGANHTNVHTYWTQKGRLFIYDLLKSDGIVPLIERDENG